MQRFKKKSDVIVGSRIIFDNMTSYIKNLPMVRMIGDVVEIEVEGDMVVVNLNIAGREEVVPVRLPYYLLQ